MSDKQNELKAKMSEARSAVLDVMGREQFKAQVDGFRPVLKDICEKHEIDELQAVVNILQELSDDPKQSLLIMAVGVEIIEPSLLDA